MRGGVQPERAEVVAQGRASAPTRLGLVAETGASGRP